MRACKRCGETKPYAEFPFLKRHNLHRHTCKTCMPQYRPGGDDRRDRIRRWNQENPEKRRAHKAVEYALLYGGMKRQPCERCGNPKAHAHHDDYLKPLDVLWLCNLHHHERHAEIGKPMGARRFPVTSAGRAVPQTPPGIFRMGVST